MKLSDPKNPWIGYITILFSSETDLIKQSIQQDRDQLIFIDQIYTDEISDGIFWRNYDRYGKNRHLNTRSYLDPNKEIKLHMAIWQIRSILQSAGNM